ncbi:T9SS type A sorting domain-containing protein [bacterium]|nr:T9SS type A sorting domain-containing protein [bacterium]
MKALKFIAIFLFIPLALFSQGTGYPEGYFYAIFRGDTFCVEPVITDSITEASWFDYTSSSMHTGYETAYESHVFFFYNPLSGNIGLVIQHNIDATGTTDATCVAYLDGLPTGCTLAMSDDSGEFNLSAYPQGDWAWWDNTDGGAFYIPRDEWQFILRTTFGSIDPIRHYLMISGHEGEESIYLDTVLIDQEDTLVLGHGFLELLPSPSDSIYFDSVMVANDTILRVAVCNSDETIDTLLVSGASHTDPRFTTAEAPGALPPDTWGEFEIAFYAIDTGLYVDTLWPNTNEPCGSNPIIIYIHCTAPPVTAEIIEPLPNTWTSCENQPITMIIGTEGSMRIERQIPSSSTSTEYYDTISGSWVPAVDISFSGWGSYVFPTSSWIWDSVYSGTILHRCLTFRSIIETPPGTVIDSASVKMYCDNTATFYMNGDSIGADDDGATWNHLFEFDMLPSMHSGSDTLTIEACDLTGVAVGLDFLATILYAIDCEIVVPSIEISIDGELHTVGDGQLTLIDTMYLIYTPDSTNYFSDGDTVHVCLNSLENTCGGYLTEPLCWDFFVDLEPPVVSNRIPMPDSIIDEPTPMISANIVDYGSGLDTATIVFTVLGDTINDYSLVFDDSLWFISWTPSEPIIAAESIMVCVYGTDTTDYCPDNLMADCWSFINMRERFIWFSNESGARCDTVLIPLYIDGLDYSWIADIEMEFSVNPEILHPLDIITDSSYIDGWAISDVIIDFALGKIHASASGMPLTSGMEGILLYLLAEVDCNASGGDYCQIIIDTIVFNEGSPLVTHEDGFFMVELEPEFFSCDIYLNRTAGTPSEDFVLTFGASGPGTDGYNSGLDVQFIPPPLWRVNGWFTISDEDYPLMNRLTRDIRDVTPPKRWIIITDNEPNGIARWNPASLPEGEFRINHLSDMKRDSVCYFNRNDTLIIDWELEEPVYSEQALSTGWNMVSCPAIPTERTAAEVFNTSLGVYRYLAPEFRYANTERIHAGEGYWVWSDSSRYIEYAGIEIENYLFSIYPGWNLIGAISTPLAVSSIASTPGGAISGALYTYEDGTYIETDSLIPNKAYWLLAMFDATIHVPSDYSRKMTPELQPLWVNRLINDEITLELPYLETCPEGFMPGDVALPPEAPGMALPKAALFADGISYRRKISSIDWLIICSEDINLTLDCPGKVILIVDNHEYHNGDIISLQKGKYNVQQTIEIPEKLSIVRCEPNPFNAKTVLVIESPVSALANIEVYDILGNKTSALKAELAPGINKITWNGKDASNNELPTGIYFVKVVSGEKLSIARVVLLK